MTGEIVSRRSNVEALSPHLNGGAGCLAEVSWLVRGGGETDFDGADGGDVAYVEEPLLETSLPDEVEESGGLGCWECEAWLAVGDRAGAAST